MGRYLFIHVKTRCHPCVSSDMLCFFIATFFFKGKSFLSLELTNYVVLAGP